MKRVKEQPLSDTHSKNGYWSHANMHGHRTPDGQIEENIRANPDRLDEGLSMYEVCEAEREVQGRVHRLMAIAKQILTQQQYNVFVLLAIKNPALTERETAKALSITRGRVHQLWVVARDKLEKAYDDRTI